MQPRFIRLRDAPRYLGMDRHRFNKLVRPDLIEIPIGIQGIAFDRLDLDLWADKYKQQNGRPPSRNQTKATWNNNDFSQSAKGVAKYEPSREDSRADFEKVLNQILAGKRKKAGKA